MRKYLNGSINLRLFSSLVFLLFSPLSYANICNQILSLNIPVTEQTTDFTCGAACFSSVLKYWRGWSPGEIPLARSLGTILNGRTDGGAIVIAANYFGLYAKQEFGATAAKLYEYLANGETVYVGYWLVDSGHYSLVQGIGAGKISLMDPWHARDYPDTYRISRIEDFVPFWNDGVHWFGQVIRISHAPIP